MGIAGEFAQYCAYAAMGWRQNATLTAGPMLLLSTATLQAKDNPLSDLEHHKRTTCGGSMAVVRGGNWHCRGIATGDDQLLWYPPGEDGPLNARGARPQGNQMMKSVISQQEVECENPYTIV